MCGSGGSAPGRSPGATPGTSCATDTATIRTRLRHAPRSPTMANIELDRLRRIAAAETLGAPSLREVPVSQPVITIDRHIIEQEHKNPGATGAFSNILYDLAFAAKMISR